MLVLIRSAQIIAKVEREKAMPRVSKNKYKLALLSRYRDLREILRYEAVMKNIDHDNKSLQEMKMIRNIARLHNVDLKEPE